jgi:hypothetical protein
MGGGFIGGDGSVQWEIFGENVGVNHATQGHKSSGCRQTGVDQTPGGTQFFEVLLDTSAVEERGPAGYRKFRLKIRPHKPKQIQVFWPSNAQSSPVAASRAMKDWMSGSPSSALIGASPRLMRAKEPAARAKRKRGKQS